MKRQSAVMGIAAAVGLGLATVGCDTNRSTPSVTNPTPTPTPVPPPNGVIVIAGTVSDTAFRPISGAVVEVVDGPQAGLSTTVDARGEFRLMGAFDDATRFRATRNGYVAATATLLPYCERCNPHRWVFFGLASLDTPVSLAGEYTVTFIADSTCALPGEVLTRTYTTVIPPAANALPANAYVSAPLLGATFLSGWGALPIGISGDYVAFWLEVVVEQLAPDTFLTFNGLAAARIGATPTSSIEFPFDGSIEYCVIKAEGGRYEDCYQSRALTRMDCRSSRHRLVLTRR
jgi:hypothetical protein